MAPRFSLNGRTHQPSTATGSPNSQEAALIGTIYTCEICKLESSAPRGWFVIHCSDSRLAVCKWTEEEAGKPKALHFCGEAHAQVYISRWFESFCGSPLMHGAR
jgi:hypothetical protein